MKYYLLNNNTLHECETPEERLELTKKLLSDSEDVPKILKRLAAIGRGHALTNTIRPPARLNTYWWFNATLSPGRIMSVLTGLAAKVDLLVASYNRGELNGTQLSRLEWETYQHYKQIKREPAVSNPPELPSALAVAVGVDPSPSADMTAIPLGGGITLQSEETEAGRIWKVASGGTVLAQTKPGSRFLVLSGTAVDGAWFHAASVTLDSIP